MKRSDDPSAETPEMAHADAVVAALIDGHLSETEARAWREAADPHRRAEADGLARVVGHLRGLPTPKAPPEVMRAVERRMRRDRRARLTPDTTQRLAWEAVVNVMLLVGLIAVYLFGMPERATRPLRPLPAGTFSARGSHAGTARAILGTYGEVREVAGDASRLAVTVPVARRAALETELSLYPFLRVDRASEAGDTATLTIRVTE
jgi:hypothetical protein